VLRQSYIGLEYVIVDGASTDRSVDIVRDYETALHAFISEPDQGHADAINKGFALTTGEIMGWINSDDILHDRSLETVAAIFDAHPEVEWITGRSTHIGERPGDFKTSRMPNLTCADFLQGRYEWIQLESTFWRRSLWDRAGG
jgi:glycosyltransferase involved in cell wall biosynthesis